MDDPNSTSPTGTRLMSTHSAGLGAPSGHPLSLLTRDGAIHVSCGLFRNMNNFPAVLMDRAYWSRTARRELLKKPSASQRHHYHHRHHRHHRQEVVTGDQQRRPW